MKIRTFIGYLKSQAKVPLKYKRASHQAVAMRKVGLFLHALPILLTVPLFPLICLLPEVSVALASDTFQSASKDESTPVATLLPAVMVHAQRYPLTNASHIIDRKTIDGIPMGNGGINEILSILPNIQYSEQSNLSTQGGEILPPAISISGGERFRE